MLEFDWDEDKRRKNIQKHRIDFVEACKIFLNDTVDIEDTSSSGERRFISIGQTQGLILAVVFTYRNDRIRIISARKASKNEKRIYYQSYPGGT
jgi:hypothetical protein